MYNSKRAYEAHKSAYTQTHSIFDDAPALSLKMLHVCVLREGCCFNGDCAFNLCTYISSIKFRISLWMRWLLVSNDVWRQKNPRRDLLIARARAPFTFSIAHPMNVEKRHVFEIGQSQRRIEENAFHVHVHKSA